MKINTKLLFRTKFTDSLNKLVRWLVRVTPESTLSIKAYKPLLDRLDLIYQTRGELALITYCKSTRLAFHRYLSGKPLDSVQGVKLTNDGIPVILGDFIPLLRRREVPRAELSVLNTILFSTRSLNPRSCPDLEPIVKSAETPFDLGGLNPFHFWKELGYNPSRKFVPRSLRWKYFHFSTKAGPNGHAMYTALRDLVSLPESLRTSIKYVGGNKLASKMTTMEMFISEGLDPMFPTERGEIRKLSHIPDKEGKARVVAVLDYYSQTALYPLHKYLFKALKKIPQDCTFNQGSFQQKISNFEVFHSIDLKSATDRFPIEVICHMLEGLLPKDYVSHWRNIMVGEPFKAWTGEYVHYGVGNPMGAYSSWNSFTLAHHFILYTACKNVGIDFKVAPYIMLGDDLVIGRDDLAEEYTRLVTSYGIEISKEKSHVSTHFFEFAKRYTFNGEEITHFPVSALRESLSRYYNMVDLFIDVDNKGWVFNQDLPDLVASLYGELLNKPKRFRRKIYSSTYLCERIAKALRGLKPANDSFNEIVRFLNIPIIEVDQSVANGIISNTIAMSFAESNFENWSEEERAKRPPLGELAANLTIHLTTPQESEEKTILATQAVDAHPILGIYAKHVEQAWLDIKRRAYQIDAFEGGDWVNAFRAVTLPESDRVFTMRARKTVMLASSIITKKFVNQLHELSQPWYGMRSDM